MMLKRYQNELIVVFTVFLLLVSLVYKSAAVNASAQSMTMGKQELSEFKELLVLKKRWLDKKTSKKIDKLEKLTPAGKLTWKKKGKKLTASYKDLTAKELNKVITSILNLPVQIERLEIAAQSKSYTVEFKCKW
jgi:phage-related minor tail protein